MIDTLPSSGPMRAPVAPTRSAGVKAIVIAALTIVMAVPLFFIQLVLSDRQGTATSAATEIATAAGGPQTVIGPFLVVPYTVEQIVPGLKNPVAIANRVRIILPDDLAVAAHADTSVRKRGIFAVPVYAARLDITARFDRQMLARQFPEGAKIAWQNAMLALSVSDLRGLADNVTLRESGRDIDFQPGFGLGSTEGLANPGFGDGRGGLHAPLALDGPRDIRLETRLMLRGSRELNFAPLGRRTAVTLDSPWASPSFAGDVLPQTRTVTAAGFKARWVVPYLARGFETVFDNPQAAWAALHHSSFGVRFYQPVDYYQLVGRSLKYAVLFVALAFLSFFVVETVTSQRLHAVQYALVGAAQVLFYLLLLSLSEHIGFAAAYLAAAMATVTLTGLYAKAVFRGVGRAALLTAMLAVLYGCLYAILNAEDDALLIGSGLLFAALAGTMYATRRIDWFGLAQGD